MATPQPSSPTGPSRLPIWLLLVALLAIAGVSVGYLLPAVPSPGTATTSTSSNTLDSHPASAEPTLPQSTTWLHEFPLSEADIRDTQEAPALAIDRAGQIALAWASKTSETERTLFFTTSHDQGRTFQEPRTITTSGIFKSGSGGKGHGGGHERRMLPRLGFGGETLHLAWCDAPLDGSSVRMLLASSRDFGQSFSQPAPLHTSEAARPTFTSLAVNEAGQVATSWLDCRHGPQQVFAAVRQAGSNDFLPDTTVFAGQNDQGVCPCCPTASYVLPDGVVLVAYRSQIDGYRDTWISRCDPKERRQFSEPIPVTSPTWKFDGCPHDGPSLAVSGDTLHIAWMDAHSGRQRAYYARAKLADMQFQVQDLNPAGPGTQGNVKLAIDSAGRLHAVWEESLADEPPPPTLARSASEGSTSSTTEKSSASKWGGGGGPPTIGAGRAIMHAISPLADGKFEAPRAIRAQPGHYQIRPAIACGADESLVTAWMELDESGKRLVVTRLPPSDRLALQPSRYVGE